jgi:O-6-methylguanine DNA methyltransferase
MKPREACSLSIPTPDGIFVARYTVTGLAALEFPPAPNLAAACQSPALPAPVLTWHAITRAAVAAMLQGKPAGELPPLDLSSGTGFQQQVWRALQTIQCGQTLSYAQVAEAIGRPRALRALGNACGANPIPLLIPCHRVLAANQRLGGFSSGLRWKRLLLEREGSWPSEATATLTAMLAL